MGPSPDAQCDPTLVLEAEEFFEELADYVLGDGDMVQLQLPCGRAFRLTPQQHAVLHYQEAFKRASTVLEQEYICKALAHSLGAQRTEVGTTLALRCALLQLSAGDDQLLPGAAKASVARWRSRIHKARLDMGEERRVLWGARTQCQAYRLF